MENKENINDLIMILPSDSQLNNTINKKNQTNFLSLESENYNESDNNSLSKNQKKNTLILRKKDRIIYDNFYDMLKGYDRDDALKIIESILDKLPEDNDEY